MGVMIKQEIQCLQPMVLLMPKNILAKGKISRPVIQVVKNWGIVKFILINFK